MEREILFSEISKMWGSVNELIGIELKSSEILFSDDLIATEKGFKGYFHKLSEQSI